jgi:hypothetical protein
MTRLSWVYDQQLGCEVAFHNGYRIKAEHDPHPDNPFETWDCNWPILVQSAGGAGYRYDLTRYEMGTNPPLDQPLMRFSDDMLVHDQHALAKIVGYTVPNLIATYGSIEPSKYCRDPDELRECLEHALDDCSPTHQFAKLVEIYDILGIPALTAETRGYCQGDWARMLAVAVPEAQVKFGRTIEDVREEAKQRLAAGDVLHDVTENVVDEQAKAIWRKSLQAAVDLYGAWAWGDCYGYVIEQPTLVEDGETAEWEEIEAGSCWGYYGSDHAESGLEEAALSAVPDEPAVHVD